MTAAVITASASITVAVLVFILNQRAQLRVERRRLRLERVGSQLRDLYGPLHALIDVNERVWQALHEAKLPNKELRRSDSRLPPGRRAEWKHWIEHALLPANRKMRDLILGHADLVVEVGMPEPLRVFCAHVAAYEVLMSIEDPDDNPTSRALIEHPGEPYVQYVRRSFADLKQEQARLLGKR